MLTSKIVPHIVRNMTVRNASYCSGPVISGPPTKHVSVAEKVGLGLIMTTTFLIVPGWVLTHMEAYKNRA